VTGGGQPLVSARLRNFGDPRVLRARALYDEDECKVIRKSHENPSIQKLYEDYLGEPGGHLSHRLLHTFYKAKEKYKG
jgi:NADP-reducing hydrogenase subunit HndD